MAKSLPYLICIIAIFTPLSSTASSYGSPISKGLQWTWIWQSNGKPINKPADIHVLDGFDHSANAYTIYYPGHTKINSKAITYDRW